MLGIPLAVFYKDLYTQPLVLPPLRTTNDPLCTHFLSFSCPCSTLTDHPSPRPLPGPSTPHRHCCSHHKCNHFAWSLKQNLFDWNKISFEIWDFVRSYCLFYCLDGRAIVSLQALCFSSFELDIFAGLVVLFEELLRNEIWFKEGGSILHNNSNYNCYRDKDKKHRIARTWTRTLSRRTRSFSPSSRDVSRQTNHDPFFVPYVLVGSLGWNIWKDIRNPTQRRDRSCVCGVGGVLPGGTWSLDIRLNFIRKWLVN